MRTPLTEAAAAQALAAEAVKATATWALSRSESAPLELTLSAAALSLLKATSLVKSSHEANAAEPTSVYVSSPAGV